MKLILARHGETAWNAEGRYQGQEDIPLSATGEAQARALGERLREVRIDRAVASPLSRALRTAQLALGDRASLLHTDAGFMEIAHGEWEGLLAAEIRARDPERLRAWRESPHEVLMPQGESLQHVLDLQLEKAIEPIAVATDGFGNGQPARDGFLQCVHRRHAAGGTAQQRCDEQARQWPRIQRFAASGIGDVQAHRRRHEARAQLAEGRHQRHPRTHFTRRFGRQRRQVDAAGDGAGREIIQHLPREDGADGLLGLARRGAEVRRQHEVRLGAQG